MAISRTERIPGFRGRVVDADSPDYDVARAIWNVLHDRRPALVAQATSPEDVAAALAYGRKRDLPIAVRGGGHSLPGHSAVDGGIVIDLRALNAMDVDPAGRRVRVGGGAVLGEVDRGAQAHGLVVPAGVVSHTGVGGLTLGGGVGRLMRRFGLTVDSLERAEVVLPDGSIVTASADEHPDLFWGLRGGGGNFGVVTEFTFRAFPLTTLVVLAAFHPLEAARDLLRQADAAMADPGTPRELLWTNFMRRGPAMAPWLPRELVGTPGVMSLIEWSGELEEGRVQLERIAEEIAPQAGEVAEVPYLAMQRITDELLAPGTLRAYVKAGFSTELTDELIEVLERQGGQVGSDLSVVEVLSMGGAIREVPADATAFPHRDARWLINTVGQWRDPGATDGEIAWVRDTFAALEPHLSGGAYSNFMEDDERAAPATAYGSTLARLQEVKAVYDPGNLLRRNQNVAPA